MASAIMAPSGPTKKQKLISGLLFFITAMGIRIMLMLHICRGSSPHQLKPPFEAVISLKAVSRER